MNMPKNAQKDRLVLIAVENLVGGGAERVALNLVQHWPRDDVKPILLVASRRGEYITDLPSDFPILEVGVSSNSARNTLRFLRKLRALLYGREIAAVISHMTHMNRMMLRAHLAGVIRAPIIAVEHSNFMKNYGIEEMPRLHFWALRAEIGFLYRRAHAVVGVSQGVTDQIGGLFGIHQNRLRAIAPPLDRRFLKLTQMDHGTASWFQELPRPILVASGRMVPLKGFDDLIRAFAMQNKGSLVILGEGPLRPKLEALADKLGVADRIAMPGFLLDPQQVLQSADLYVSASHWEGYSLALIEAYASGLPVAVMDCDFGPSEIILPNRPGRLVRSRDLAAFSEAIGACLANEARFSPGTVVDLGENNPDYVAARYSDLLMEAM